ncbi:MAG: Methyl-accepting chemotaxis sensory transducer [Candidatus Gottesmanbacteria bacterium GW2011_GWA2_43_14]|uniref:Methyl-accepting chemotaxis sensory transducer n=1 Tax=Candidatus Gottesmanbacteria bacterium GW2011_GWA2_43_14 TaxID=1618443 RepID=A0A0G1GF38_9BACT|nr:MAG: Methyl-accepting chemotaxis sensory transducer [Candidatus Gottesmanbacteria bacterium GW2011_GWA2_43_14]
MPQLKSTKTKLFLIQFLAIIPYLLFIFYLFDLWFETSRSHVLEINLNEAKLLSLYLHDNLTHGLSVSKTLAKTPDFLTVFRDNPEMVRRAMHSIIENHPDLNSIYILNPEGQTLMFESASPVPGAEGASASDREYYQKTVTTKKSVVSDPFTGKVSGIKIVAMTDPVIREGEVAAIVVTTINMEGLRSQLENHMTDRGIKYTYILDSSDNLVFSPFHKNIEVKYKTAFNDEDFLDEVSKGRTVLLDYKSIPTLDDNVMGAAIAVKDYNWTVISVQPAQDVFAPLFKVQSISWLIILSSLAFSILVISYYLKRIKLIF